MNKNPKARLLIVDDEAPLLEALCHTLKTQGYLTTGFVSAQDALTALRQQPFDLLLTDLKMPEMDGITFLSQALKIDPQLVSIVMTGQGTIRTAVEAMQVGALDYILKPFKLSVILPVLSRSLAMRQLRLENAELQRRVSEHTAELEAANQELEAFSFSVSHDLRAPLRHIDGYAKILIEKFSPHMFPESQRLLGKVCRSAERMGQLIEDLLKFSRLGRQPLAKQSVNVAVLVRDVVEELRKEQGNRQIEIRVGDLPDCVGDPSLLRQVLVNLLSNAFKYTSPKEQPLIEVDGRRQDGETTYFVRDNGVGFNMQYAQNLFGVFQRLHSAMEFEGTGVGLSIVQRIIHRHNGRVWAEGKVNAGATFYFSLPLAGGTPPVGLPPVAAGLPVTNRETNGREEVRAVGDSRNF